MSAPPPRTDWLENAFGPLAMLGFAGAWWADGIYTATAVLMALMTLQAALMFFLRGAIKKPVLLMWLLVLALGGLTLLLRDKAFIQLKTSLVYGAFAVVLLAAEGLGKNLPKMALGGFFAPPAEVWRRVTWLAAGYFALLSLCNYLVAKFMSEAAWVGIKTFGFPAATLVMTLGLVAFLYRYAVDADEAADAAGADDGKGDGADKEGA